MLTRHVLGEAVNAAFTDRYGGVSAPPYAELNLGGGGDCDAAAIATNRGRVAAALGVRAEGVVWMRQQHGNEVAHVDVEPGRTAPAVDATVTTTPGLTLAVLVADCVPVLLTDPERGLVGAAHAGRLGLTRGVVPALVARAVELGGEPGRMAAMLGPAVCGSCYEVPRAMRDEVASVAPAARCSTREGAPGLDIRAGVEAQLRGAGVSLIHRDARCTRESPEMYSHRREGRTGRFAGYVWLG